MAEVGWTAEAQLWLHDIYDYIAADNPEAAGSAVMAIHCAARSPREHPRLGYRYQYETDREVRILLHGHYRRPQQVTTVARPLYHARPMPWNTRNDVRNKSLSASARLGG